MLRQGAQQGMTQVSGPDDSRAAFGNSPRKLEQNFQRPGK
jgi:hypothetical protein